MRANASRTISTTCLSASWETTAGICVRLLLRTWQPGLVTQIRRAKSKSQNRVFAGPCVCLEVRDNGSGMTDSTLSGCQFPLFGECLLCAPSRRVALSLNCHDVNSGIHEKHVARHAAPQIACQKYRRVRP